MLVAQSKQTDQVSEEAVALARDELLTTLGECIQKATDWLSDACRINDALARGQLDNTDRVKLWALLHRLNAIQYQGDIVRDALWHYHVLTEAKADARN